MSVTKVLKNVVVVLLFACLIFSGLPISGSGVAVQAAAASNITVDDADFNVYSYNEGRNDYYSWTSPVRSYITKTDNGYMTVRLGNPIQVIYYDTSFNYVSHKNIKINQDNIAGFYESGQNYYVVSGNDNYDESDSVEVIRITKYDKKWKKLDACRIYGYDTQSPFAFGSCSMTMIGKYLIVYTCHTAYKMSDGLNHQFSLPIVVDTKNMEEIKDGLVTGASHSFNQLARTDGSNVVLMDHGDANPRNINITTHEFKNVDNGTLDHTGWNRVCIMKFPGERGENYTGASLGAMEMSKSHYIVVGNAVYYPGFTESVFKNNRTRNIFLAAVDKKKMDNQEYGYYDALVPITWLTTTKEGGTSATTPQLVKISDNQFAVLWSVGSNIKYTFIDGTGKKTSKTFSQKGSLSDCAPIADSGKIIWFTWYDNIEKIYTVSITNPDKVSIKSIKYEKKTTDGTQSTKITSGMSAKKADSIIKKAQSLILCDAGFLM